MHVQVPLLGGSHLLSALGMPVEGMTRALRRFSGELDELADGFAAQTAGLTPQTLGRMLYSGQVPPPGGMPGPNMGRCSAGRSYSPPREIDFSASSEGVAPWGCARAGMCCAATEGFLRENPYARQNVEMALGGRILPGGFNDGRMFVQRFAPGYFPSGGQANTAANTAYGMINDFNQAAARVGVTGPGTAKGAMLGGLANVFGGMNGAPQQYGASQYGGGAGAMSAPVGRGSPGAMSGLGAMGGTRGGAMGGPMGGGTYMPGGRPVYAGPGSLGAMSGILSDPALTVEDKVTLFLMQIMKRMDNEIEQQMNYVNQLQNQGGRRGQAGGAGGGDPNAAAATAAGLEPGGSDSSIDVETIKLKRLIDKRSQMFDMLRQIVDKYNETAKGIIQSMGR